MGRRGAHPGEVSTAPGELCPLSQGGFYPLPGCPGTFAWAAPVLGRTGASRRERGAFHGRRGAFHGKRSTSRVHPWGLTREALYRSFHPRGFVWEGLGLAQEGLGACWSNIFSDFS